MFSGGAWIIEKAASFLIRPLLSLDLVPLLTNVRIREITVAESPVVQLIPPGVKNKKNRSVSG